jgi:hypothetical protein
VRGLALGKLGLAPGYIVKLLLRCGFMTFGLRACQRCSLFGRGPPFLDRVPRLGRGGIGGFLDAGGFLARGFDIPRRFIAQRDDILTEAELC